ncbi:MAG TPA: DUF3455 domain-containing protein [Usitatibacter sp.]|nr:DUF3455 domain-containing protein [Usitatibacter sp.]
MGNRSLFLATVVAAALPAAAALTEPANIAPLLRAPANETPAFVLNGNGVYIYQCRQSLLDANAFEWAFVVPDATLYEGTRGTARHATVGLFESLSDRSSLSGVVRTSQAAGVRNLPWVLMRAQPLAANGMFAGITSVQRVNTVGGAAPTGGCGPGNIGEEARVAYQADYYFYRSRGAS